MKLSPDDSPKRRIKGSNFSIEPESRGTFSFSFPTLDLSQPALRASLSDRRGRVWQTCFGGKPDYFRKSNH